jgi:hypothetical protein
MTDVNLDEYILQLDQLSSQVTSLRTSLPLILQALANRNASLTGDEFQQDRLAAFKAAAARTQSQTTRLVGEVEKMQQVFAYADESRRKRPNAVARALLD